MPLKAREFDAIVAKLGMTTRQSDHFHAWLEVDGRVVVRTRRSHGSGDLPASDLIRQQLKVNEQQLGGLIDCSMRRDEYIAHLRSRGIL